MESLSSSLDFCPPGSHDSCEAEEAKSPALKELKDRLMVHMEQARFLRAQNAQLSEKLAGLQRHWGRDTEQLRQLSVRENSQLRAAIEESERSRAEAEARLENAEAEKAKLLTEQKKLEVEVEQLKTQSEREAEEAGERAKTISALQRRVQLLNHDKVTEREKRQQLRRETDSLLAIVASNSAKLALQEREKQRLQEQLQFQLQAHALQQRELQRLLQQSCSCERILQQYRAEHNEVLAEAMREAEKRQEFAQTSLRATYEKKIQELHALQQQHFNSETDTLRRQNKQLTQGWTNAIEKIDDLTTTNEKLSRSLAEKEAVLSAERRHFAEAEDAKRRDLSAASAQVHHLAELAERSAKGKEELDREIDVFRALMKVELSDVEPKSEAHLAPERQTRSSVAPSRRPCSKQQKPEQLLSKGSSSEERPTSDNVSNLKLNSTSASRKNKEEGEKPSLSKVGSLRYGASGQATDQ